MVTVRGNALIGPELEFRKNIKLDIDEKGKIRKISQEENPADYILPPTCLIVPGFINGHTHVADACLKDQTFGLSLEEAVGPNGIKHSKLKSSSKEEKKESIRNSLELLVQNGFTTFIDFREEGLEGIQLLKSEMVNFPIRGIIHGRPYQDDILKNIFEAGDGLGFADVFSIDDEVMNEVKQLKKKFPEKKVGIHVAESMEVISQSLTRYGKPDIEKICEYSEIDYVVHATYLDYKDLEYLKKNNINVICCPLSNLYHGLKFPPLHLIKEGKILLGLGTDNTFCCNPDPFRLMAFTLYNASSNQQKITPKDVLKALTVNLGQIMNEKIGQITEGYSGDFVGINLGNPNIKYSKDVYSAVTMRAEPSDIDFQMFNGKIVKWKDQK